MCVVCEYTCACVICDVCIVIYMCACVYMHEQIIHIKPAAAHLAVQCELVVTNVLNPPSHFLGTKPYTL